MNNLLLWAHAALDAEIVTPSGGGYTITMTLDRTFSDTPAAGGGNVSPQTFTHNGHNWELWQVVPFIGIGVDNQRVGNCRVQLRNRNVNRDAMQLVEMPSSIILTQSGWASSPWTFNRPTDSSKFFNVGSGNASRKGIDYEPASTVAANPSAAGVSQGQTFTIQLMFTTTE